MSPTPRRSHIWLKLLFATAIFLIFFEFGVRHFVGDVRVKESQGQDAYFKALGVHPSDQPLPDKPAVTPKTRFRVVVAGDSTAVGFPYGLQYSFGELLKIGLAACGHDIDVITIGIAGRSSVGVIADLDAALAFEPDLLVVYVGHNEFAHRISQISPLGRNREGADVLVQGFSDIFRVLRERRDAANALKLPAMFGPELKVAQRIWRSGDPEARFSVSLPMRDRERTYHESRFGEHITKIGAAARDRNVPVLFVEPVSNLFSAPLASGKLYDPRASAAWTDGIQQINHSPGTGAVRLAEARDLDPAPVRLSTKLRTILRESAGKSAFDLSIDPLERRFIDFVHPEPALAAGFASKLASALPVPELRAAGAGGANNDIFIKGIRQFLDSPEARAAIARGDGLGRMLSAQMHLEYGNREAAERDVASIPAAERNFGHVIIYDLALRFRGAGGEASAALEEILLLHPDWRDPVDWWRSFVASQK